MWRSRFLRVLFVALVALLVGAVVAPSALANAYGMRYIDWQTGQGYYRGAHGSITWTTPFSGIGSPNFVDGSFMGASFASGDAAGDQSGVTQENNSVGDDCISDTNGHLYAFAEVKPFGGGYSCNVTNSHIPDNQAATFGIQRVSTCGTCWGGWYSGSELIHANIGVDQVQEMRAIMEVAHAANMLSGASAHLQFGAIEDWARTSQVHGDPSTVWSTITGGGTCDFNDANPTCGSVNNWTIGSLPDPFTINWIGS